MKNTSNTKYPQAKMPLILRSHRLMDAFAKSNDERDFYLDTVEGFIIFADLDKSEEDLLEVYKEIGAHKGRYILLPKMTFFEIKKFMEGFVTEKVYDIDVKEKLLDIISMKDARENFLEFIYDHLTELEKWQQYYQERSRIKIIEWLRQYNTTFVFEEDLDLTVAVIEKLKRTLFDDKVSKELTSARNFINIKAKTYYSNEALNPRPKRGRPPKQALKIEIEPQFTIDIYTTVPKALRLFLYIPEITTSTAVTFSGRFDTEEQLLASLKGAPRIKVDEKLEALSERLESLQTLTQRFGGVERVKELEKIKTPFQPFSKREKFSDKKSIKISKEKKEDKMGSAVGGVLSKKRGRPKKDEDESVYTPQKRKKFSVKKVSQITKKKK
jgi:hypothetical protein